MGSSSSDCDFELTSLADLESVMEHLDTGQRDQFWDFDDVLWYRGQPEDHSCHIVWKERAVHEGGERFVDIVDILKRKYGDRLVDMVPTDASGGYLYGDNLVSVDLVDTARASLRGKKD